MKFTGYKNYDRPGPKERIINMLCSMETVPEVPVGGRYVDHQRKYSREAIEETIAYIDALDINRKSML